MLTRLRRQPQAAVVARLVAICALAVALIPAFASPASAFQPCPTQGVPAANIDSWTTTWPVAGADPMGLTMCQGMGATALAYVQIIDFNDGSYVTTQASCSTEPGACTDPDLSRHWFRTQTAEDWHGEFRFPTPGRASRFSTVNAGFFHKEDGKAYMSLPLDASSGGGRSHGYALFDNDNAAWIAPKKKLIYSRYWDARGGYRPQRVTIGEFPTYYTAQEAQAIFDDDVEEWGGLVGFAPDYVAPGGDVLAKRTMVGVNEAAGKMYILTTRVSNTLPEAIAILKAFGSQEEIQLDGGNSTQLYSQWGQISSEIGRAVPNTLNVVAWKPAS